MNTEGKSEGGREGASEEGTNGGRERWKEGGTVGRREGEGRVIIMRGLRVIDGVEMEAGGRR